MAASNELCGTCSRDDKSTVGVKVCIDCGDALCEACLKAHGLFKAFSSHHLVDVGVLPSSTVLKSNEFCYTHPEKKLDFFCTQHESLCCRSCMVENHRTCQSVLPIEDASENVDKSSLIVDTPTSLQGIINTLDKIDENRKSNSVEIKRDVKNIIDAVGKMKSQALKKIDEAEKMILEQLRQMEAKETQEMNAEEKEVRSMRETTQKYMKEFDVTTKLGSKNHKFILLQMLTSKIQSLGQNLQQKVTSLKSTSITFSEASNFMSSTLDSFGSLKTNTGHCSLVYNIEKHKQAQVMQPPNTMPPKFRFDGEIKVPGKFISSIAVTQNHVLMCISNDKAVIIYNKDCKEQKSCGLSGKPWDISLIPDSDLAVVSLPDLKSIQFIHFSQLEAGKTILSPNNEEINGITATTDTLFLGGAGQITVTDLDCNILTIFKPIGSGIYTLYYMHIDNNKNVFCSVLGDKIVICSDVKGKLVFKYKDETFDCLEGMTTDEQGNVYVVNKNKGQPSCIHMLSSDGTYKGKVLQEYTFKTAWDICYEKNSRKMYIAHNTDTVSVFNLL